ncbi:MULTISPECIES: Uma2 family endonuclease [unclassified Synechococcus]|uniref:Uma2 family endonuclease n=1 Tax=unclassified Synechococcus TaxID=2626047 RepID=UPI0020CD81E0|nr:MULTISPECIES: Uma2 family endonuclease [unclassified Synechococcus]
MTLAAGPVIAASTAPMDALAPLRLPAELRLTPEQFALVCAENCEAAVLELAADGQLIQMSPTGSETGARKSRLVMRPAAVGRSAWRMDGV